jgi:hypothetical protein
MSLVALTMFLYLPGISCNLVLTASKGFVKLVANPAATTPLEALIVAEDANDAC